MGTRSSCILGSWTIFVLLLFACSETGVTCVRVTDPLRDVKNSLPTGGYLSVYKGEFIRDVERALKVVKQYFLNVWPKTFLLGHLVVKEFYPTVL